MAKLGINEKSLPFQMSWRDKLNLAKKHGFSFVEISIDETDERIERLDWNKEQRFQLVRDVYETGIPIDTMMLSLYQLVCLFHTHLELTETVVPYSNLSV